MNNVLFSIDVDIPRLGVKVSDLGGKVCGLIRLCKCGFDVPRFAVISAGAVKEQVWKRDKNFCDEVSKWVKLLEEETGNGTIIARSSSKLEDQKHHSYAGVFKSLVIKREEEIFQSLGEIVEHYESEMIKRRLNKFDLSIILQKYIEGEISGVCFSVDPVRANPKFGYGECVFQENRLLVNGSCVPTRFTFTFFPPRIVNVFHGDQAPLNVAEEMLSIIVECLLRMECEFKYPVDIEWTWDGKKVWFLQARYITTLQADKSLFPSECATSWFFDQRFIEPITPFTRDALLPPIVKRAHSDALKMRKKESEVDFHLFGGQVYIPHRVYIDILGDCPRWWLSNDLKQLFPGDCPCKYKNEEIIGLRFWLNSFYELFKNYKHSLLVLHSWKRWRNKTRLLLDKWAQFNLSNLRSEEWLQLWNTLQSLTEEFLAIHRWAILWANYVYRLGGKYIIEFARKIGITIPSITQVANRTLVEYLKTREENLRRELISKYGHRCENLDYFSPRWAEVVPKWEEEVVSENNSDMITTDNSEKSSSRKILSKLLRPIFKLPIEFINLREEQRFEWEKVLYLKKKLVLEVAKNMQEKNMIEDLEDVWFLTWDEFLDFLLSNRFVRPDIIAMRKHEWCVYHSFKKPLFIGGECEEESVRVGVLELKGVGVSYGRVVGRVHLMSSPEDLFPNIPSPRVLVGQSLNPGQTWCLELWDGFILETGSELSHPAILAREYQVPMITAVENATNVLTEGDLVEIDCEKSTVRILKSGLNSGNYGINY
ncbi:MAG: PEP-utilizing enzyme [Candidatus Hydrogenedentes bacterium]|nr:PEP-utilizing enzyme [Candidatus Hydrogenedentota bacterium]